MLFRLTSVQCGSKQRLLVLLLAVCGFFFLLLRWKSPGLVYSLDGECPLAVDENTPLVLFWKLGNRKTLLREFEQTADCPHSCVFTADPGCASRAAVHVLHACPYDFPSPLPADRLLVHLALESPHNSAVWRDDPAYFNATLSYRSTATVFHPYGRLVARNGREATAEVWSEQAVKAAVKRKKSKVLLSISNCNDLLAPSGRLEYAEALEKHIEITKTGGCFDRVVSADELKSLVADHHFFLAFENSVCPEYTTEKFWRLKDLIVPVVLSRGAVNPHEVPKGTFIAASDFETPQKLAEYLDFLIQNKQEYEKFFDWTKRFRKTREDSAACRLCELATTKQSGLRIPDVNAYWNRSECIADYGRKLLERTPEFESEEARMSELVRRTGRRREL